MAIKDLQTLYEEGFVATTLDGSELLLIEQGGLSKVVTVGTLAQYFMAYFEANSSCCQSCIASVQISASDADVASYGAESIVITVNGTESMTLSVAVGQSWKAVLRGQSYIIGGVSIGFAEGIFAESPTLDVTNLTALAGSDLINIKLIARSGESPQIVAMTDGVTTINATEIEFLACRLGV